MTLCRFDYVVQITNALRKYMGTCASDDDTLGLVNAAHRSLDALYGIELGIEAEIGRKRNKKFSTKAVTTALEEYKQKYKQIEPQIKRTEDFLAKYKREIVEVKNLAAYVTALEAQCKMLTALQEYAEKQVAGACEPVADGKDEDE